MKSETSAGGLVLVTGPAKSGKSEWAEILAMQSGKPVIYLATAKVDATDAEWRSRIQQHRDRRALDWLTLEVPENLVETIKTTPSSSCLLIDSLGTWVANLLEKDNTCWQTTQQNLILNLEKIESKHVIIVAEETGWGVVPAYTTGRLFRDRLGNLVRLLGSFANPVYLVTGGHVLNLSVLGSPLPATITHRR